MEASPDRQRSYTTGSPVPASPHAFARSHASSSRSFASPSVSRPASSCSSSRASSFPRRGSVRWIGFGFRFRGRINALESVDRSVRRRDEQTPHDASFASASDAPTPAPRFPLRAQKNERRRRGQKRTRRISPAATGSAATKKRLVDDHPLGVFIGSRIANAREIFSHTHTIAHNRTQSHTITSLGAGVLRPPSSAPVANLLRSRRVDVRGGVCT